MSKKVILVPTDFSEAANVAYSQSISIAKIFNIDLCLLHILKKGDDIVSNKGKIERVAKELSGSQNIGVKGIVRTGSIFEDINEVAEEINAKFIVMGIHQVKGMQKFLGTPALKVIASSKIPFILVQEDSTLKNYYKNIVLPLDLTLETKQKLGHASEIATKFKSTIHIIVPKTTNKSLAGQLKKNIAFAQNYLNEHNITYQIKMATGTSFSKEVIDFSNQMNADLIAIMNAQDSSITGFGGNPKQNIITNTYRIPVLCVNPRDAGVSFWK